MLHRRALRAERSERAAPQGQWYGERMKSSHTAAFPPMVMGAIVVLGAIAVFSFTLFFCSIREHEALTPGNLRACSRFLRIMM